MVASSLSLSDASRPSEELKRFTYTEYHMGIDARLVVYARDQKTAEEACTDAFARIAELDGIMSDYRKDSELMTLCSKAGGPPVRVSRDLFVVLKSAEKMSRLSGGAFDVTVGPLVSLWRQARKSKQLPTASDIETARKLVGWRRVILSESKRTAKLLAPGMKLDLGGIAKGYAADQAQIVLKHHGIYRALVEMGGEIVVSHAPPGSKGWKIRIPNAEKDGVAKDMEFVDRAVSTSGDTEQFVVIGGVQYSHVVDPRTGQALTNRVQATVTAKTGLVSDPLATSLTVLDERGRRKLLKSFSNSKVYVRALKGEGTD